MKTLSHWSATILICCVLILSFTLFVYGSLRNPTLVAEGWLFISNNISVILLCMIILLVLFIAHFRVWLSVSNFPHHLMLITTLILGVFYMTLSYPSINDDSLILLNMADKLARALRQGESIVPILTDSYLLMYPWQIGFLFFTEHLSAQSPNYIYTHLNPALYLYPVQ